MSESQPRDAPAPRGGLDATRRRLRQHEVRERVLARAEELVAERGLTVSLQHLQLEDLIAQAQVPRTAFYRQWDSREKFVRDLLKRVAGPSNWKGTAAFDENTRAMAQTLVCAEVHNHPERFTEPSERWEIVLEIVRETVDLNFRTILESVEWKTYVSLVATVMSTTEIGPRDELIATLRDSEAALVERMTEFYQGMGGALGVRPRATYSWAALAVAGAGLIEGLALRHAILPELVDQQFELDGPAGGSWTLAAIGFRGIVENMLELADFSPPPQLPGQQDEWLRERGLAQ